MALGAADAGWQCDIAPISDGGEGLLDCFGGANRTSTVTGPLGEPVDAGWRLDGTAAVIEMATASGLTLVAGRNDPVAATTKGTGELIAAALDAGASEILVGVGGSATTDGGLGAVDESGHARAARPRHGRSGRDDPLRRCRRGVRAAEGRRPRDCRAARRGGCATCSRCTATGSASASASSPGRARPAGSPAGWQHSARGSDPGSTSSRSGSNLAQRVRSADLVLTGEGRLDRSSLSGKAPVGGRPAVRRRRTAGRPHRGRARGCGRPGRPCDFTRATNRDETAPWRPRFPRFVRPPPNCWAPPTACRAEPGPCRIASVSHLSGKMEPW